MFPEMVVNVTDSGISSNGNDSSGSTGLSNGSAAGDEHSAEYLAQLLKDKKQLAAFPNIFSHVERLVDEEIQKVRISLFHLRSEKPPLILPEPEGPVVLLTEKIIVPVKTHPDYNFVGRILGPRGMTAKQLEQETSCKIMIRGRGSMRDKQKEEQNRGKPNWEHLNEELHVLITSEDTENRAQLKIQRAADEIQLLLIPSPEGEDDLKRKQLMELAIINGTYRPASPAPRYHIPLLHYLPPGATLTGDGLTSPSGTGGLRLIPTGASTPLPQFATVMPPPPPSGTLFTFPQTPMAMSPMGAVGLSRATFGAPIFITTPPQHNIGSSHDQHMPVSKLIFTSPPPQAPRSVCITTPGFMAPAFPQLQPPPTGVTVTEATEPEAAIPLPQIAAIPVDNSQSWEVPHCDSGSIEKLPLNCAQTVMPGYNMQPGGRPQEFFTSPVQGVSLGP